MIEQLQSSLESMAAEKELLQSAVEGQKEDIQRTEREKAEMNSLAEHLTDQIEALQKEMSAVVDDAAAVRSKHHSDMSQLRLDLLREISEHKAKIFALENDARKATADLQLPAAAPAMLESQVQELSSALEALTLDKEQLSVDYELLEERYLQVQIDLEEALLRAAAIEGGTDGSNATATAGGTETDGRSSSGNISIQSLKTENNRLREALRLLNASSTHDKALLSRLDTRLDSQEGELDALRAYKRQAEDDLFLLRQAVDASQSYEDMIERLSGDNSVLVDQMEECRRTIADLEEAQELNEEIDHAQRTEIATSHETISALKDCIVEVERRVELKEGELVECKQRLERVQRMCVSLKQEASQLHSMLSSESQEVRQMTARLRDASSMRTTVQLQAAELAAMHSSLLVSTSLRYKYQTLFVRMEAIFGATSFFVEEAKRANIESALVSAATAGLDACRVLAGALTAVFAVDDGLMRTLRDDDGRKDAVPLLGRLYLLLLQLQSYCVNCTIDYFVKDDHSSNDGACERVVMVLNCSQQVIVDMKHGFESVKSVSSRLQALLHGLCSDYTQHQSRHSYDSLMADVEGSPGRGVTADHHQEEESLLTSFSNASYQVSFSEILHECEDTIAVLVDCSRAIVGGGAASGGGAYELSEEELLLQTLLVLSTDADGCSLSASSTIKLEFLLIAFNLLLDMALHQLQRSVVDGAAVADGEVTSSLRGIKRDTIKLASVAAAASSTSIIDLPTLMGHYRSLLSCFDHQGSMTFDLHRPQVLPALQSMAASLRDWSTAAASMATTRQVLFSPGDGGGGGAALMTYFPALAMTNCFTQQCSDVEESFRIDAELREQVNELVDKFWMLLVSPNSSSELLLQSVPMAGVLGLKGNSPAIASVRDTVRWKSRVAELRRVVMSRLSDDDRKAAEDNSGSAMVSQSIDAGSSSSQPIRSQAALTLQVELDIKREELQSALKKCVELQSQLDDASQTHPPPPAPPQGDYGPSEVDRLQREVRTLEDALHATEQRAEATEKELKLLKAQLTMQGLIQGGSSGRRGGAGTGSAAAASKMSISIDCGVSKPLVDAHPGSRVVPQGVYDAAMLERSYWKGLALRRLTSSLLPLTIPNHGGCTVVSDGTPAGKPMADLKMEPLTLLANIRSGGSPESVVAVLNNLRVQSSSSSDSQGGSLLSQYSRLYHQIRLARPAGMRIKRLGGLVDVSAAQPIHRNAPQLSGCVKPHCIGGSTVLLYRIRDDSK